MKRLRLSCDIIVAPMDAFARIAQEREWFEAFTVIFISTVIGVALLTPALAHITMVKFQADPTLARIDPAFGVPLVTIQAFANQLIWQIILWIFCALILTTVAAGREHPGNFRTFLALNVNCAVPTALGFLFSALVIATHNPSSFHNFNDLVLGVPDTLASFHPDAGSAAFAFLSFWDIFTFWSMILVGYGYATITRISLIPSLLLSLGIGIAFAFVTTQV